MPGYLDNEKVLLERIAEGDQKAFEQLALAYSEKVFFHVITFVKSHPLAEEIVQDIFVKIWKNRKKLIEVVNFDSYLFISSKHELISAMRKRILSSEKEMADDIEETLYRPDKQYETRELQELLEKGIESLPDLKKNVFRLVHQEGLSQKEVSQRLGVATRTVRWNLVSANNLLRYFLLRHIADMPPVSSSCPSSAVL